MSGDITSCAPNIAVAMIAASSTTRTENWGSRHYLGNRGLHISGRRARRAANVGAEVRVTKIPLDEGSRYRTSAMTILAAARSE